MDPIILMQDVIRLLRRNKALNKEYQEAIIKRYMNNDEVNELEKIMKEYEVDYSCDFRILNEKVIEDAKSDLFHVV